MKYSLYRKGKDKVMKNKAKIIMGIVIALVFVAAVGAILFKKFAPSYTQRTMEEQYKDLATDLSGWISAGRKRKNYWRYDVSAIGYGDR